MISDAELDSMGRVNNMTRGKSMSSDNLMDKVGCLFTIDGSNVFRMVHYENAPTITLRNLETGEILVERMIDVKRRFGLLVAEFTHVPNADAVSRPNQGPCEPEDKFVKKSCQEYLRDIKLHK